MKLFLVQETAKGMAVGRDRYGYFLEMGLGKTLLTLVEYNEMLAAGDVDILMIFCPNTLISTWKGEIKKHGFDFPIVTKPELVSEIKPGSVVLYNYESIIATAGKLIPMILAQFRTGGIFDESVQIKNFQSARWKQIRKWESKLSYVRLLSGRPMVQSPMDLWSQLTLLRGEVSSSPYAFRNTFCRMGGWMNKQVVGIQNEDRLREVTKKVSFTATKARWTDLPEKLYTDRFYTMTDEQKKIYKKMLNDMVVEFSTTTVSVQQAVHKYNKLQQVGSGFMLDEQGEPVLLMPFTKVPKVVAMEEFIEGVTGKTIIFAHYRASVEALAQHYDCPVIRGGMSEQEIKDAVDRFNTGDDDRMVAQLAAAKYGLTLLGHEAMPCHTTVYFENTYSLDARIQSEDRNHRHGQKNAVLYADMIGSPVERKITAALQKKDDISKLIMGMKEEKENVT